MVFKYFSILLLVFFTVLVILPVYLMVKVSLSPPEDIMVQRPGFLIRNVTFRHWKDVFKSGRLWQPLKKSIIVATTTALLALLISIPGAYVISHLSRTLRYSMILSLFFTRMFPEVGIALPIAVNFIKWGLFDTNLGLTMAHLIRVLPVTAWILIGTYRTIPSDLEDAAQVDGCGRLGVLKHVVLPLALPGISVALIFSWLMSWDEFTYALYLCLREKTMPLQVYYYISRGDWFLTASYATIITIPVIFVTYILQKYLRSGYLAGAVKG